MKEWAPLIPITQTLSHLSNFRLDYKGFINNQWPFAVVLKTYELYVIAASQSIFILTFASNRGSIEPDSSPSDLI